MSILDRFTRWVGRTAAVAESLPSVDPALFVYIKIPEDIGPLDRGEKYEDPIDAEFKRSGLGEVSGGGTSRLQDVYESGEWAIGRPREMLHPGFGI